MEAAVAWKNSVFDFNNEPLSVIMRSLSRWYDVDVLVFEVRIFNLEFCFQHTFHVILM